MPNNTNVLAASFDTASDTPGVALSRDGLLLAEATWQTHQGHSRELIPTLEWLLARAGLDKKDIGALFVCVGPGSYAGLRSGVSTAKALSYALAAPLVGVGRLAADAEPLVAVTAGRVVPLQAAGRAELAWAIYQRSESGTSEIEAPRLSPLAVLLDAIRPEDTVCADIRSFDPSVIEALRGTARVIDAPSQRVAAVARIGTQRLAAGAVDNADSLVPLYLRAPAIGPQS